MNTAKRPAYLLLSIACFKVLLYLISAAGHYPKGTEKYYAQGFYRAVIHVVHPVFNVFPFSVGDCLYILAIAGLVYALYQVLRLAVTKQFRVLGTFLLQLLLVLQIATVAFQLLWGLNYYRMPLAQRTPWQDTTYTPDQLKTVAALLIDSANARRAAINSTDEQSDNSGLYKAAATATQHLGQLYPVFYPVTAAKVKSSLFTPFLNYAGTSGYYNPFTGEAQMNRQMPWFDRPVTCCHEMGHQMGYGREDEANFIGFMAGINADSRSLQYSAYYLAMDEFLYHLRRRDTVAYHELKQRISVQVRQDMRTDSLYWTGYQTRIEHYTSFFYDKFLKANNQPEGLRTYNRMIRLTMAYYKSKEKVLFLPEQSKAVKVEN